MEQKEKNKLPTIQELYNDVELTKKKDDLMVLLNQPPHEPWVKQHPFINGYKYLPIDKVEYLLKRIFKDYKIEVLKTGMLLNCVEVTVRVHYSHPITGDWLYHDGVGASEIQTEKGSGHLKVDMSNINRGAVIMALPNAKSIAIKDACDHLGKVFGSDIMRKDTLNYTTDVKLSDLNIEKIKQQND